MKKLLLFLSVFAFCIHNGQITLRDLGRALGNEVVKEVGRSVKRSAEEKADQKKADDETQAKLQELIAEKEARAAETARMEKYHASYSFEKVDGIYGGDMRVITKDSQNSLWLGTGGTGAVYQFNEHLQKWEQKTKYFEGYTVVRISEIEGIVFAKLTSRKTNYQYEEFDEFIIRLDNNAKLSEQQFVLVNSELAADYRKRKEKLFESLVQQSGLDDLIIEPYTLNDIEKINNKYFILDTRGLFYFEGTDPKVKEANVEGINNSRITQILPHKDGIFLWSQDNELWSINGNSKFRVFSLGYNEFSLFVGKMKLHWLQVLQSTLSEFKEHKEAGPSYVTISENGLVAIVRDDRIYTASIDNSFQTKATAARTISGSSEEYSDAIYDNKGFLFAVEKSGDLVKFEKDGEKKVVLPANKLDKNLKGLRLDKLGRAYYMDSPLFLNLDETKPDWSPQFRSTLSRNINDFKFIKEFGSLRISNATKATYNRSSENNLSEYFSFELLNARTEEDYRQNVEDPGFDKDRWTLYRYENLNLEKYELKNEWGKTYISILNVDGKNYLVGTDGIGVLKLTIQ